MSRRRAAVTNRRRSRKNRKWRISWSQFLPSASTRRQWYRAFARLPGSLQAILGAALLLALWLAVNGIYQVVRKPSELFFPISGVLHKTPQETWRTYAPLFRKHSTRMLTPEFLAALAQIEGSGNPLVRTYWRWAWRADPFEVYRPASSAVGMYQITNGTFVEARRYCIHDHVVVTDGPWYDWRSCWFNRLYTRTVPSHAVEMTAAYLDHHVTQTLRRHGIQSATLRQKQELAAIIHLCGAGAGAAYARQGLRLTQGQRCGDHEVRGYLARLNSMKAQFARLASAG